MEVGLAADSRHADAVAVAADARDHALDQVLHLRVVGPAEAQRVQVGDGPRAHREHVAQDAPHAGRRALVRLDVAGVIVALHLEDGGLTITDVDHARVLAGAADHPGRLGGQLHQVELARLVGAMLGPHDREDAELDVVRLAAERVEDAGVLLFGQPVGGDDIGGDGYGGGGHGRALARRGAWG